MSIYYFMAGVMHPPLKNGDFFLRLKHFRVTSSNAVLLITLLKCNKRKKKKYACAIAMMELQRHYLTKKWLISPTNCNTNIWFVHGAYMMLFVNMFALLFQQTIDNLEYGQFGAALLRLSNLRLIVHTKPMYPWVGVKTNCIWMWNIQIKENNQGEKPPTVQLKEN